VSIAAFLLFVVVTADSISHSILEIVRCGLRNTKILTSVRENKGMREVFKLNREKATHILWSFQSAFVTTYCGEFKRCNRILSQRFRQLNLKKETLGFQKFGNLYVLVTSYIRIVMRRDYLKHHMQTFAKTLKISFTSK
jgi:hypothetical protein